MRRCFLKSAAERKEFSLAFLKRMSIKAIYKKILALQNTEVSLDESLSRHTSYCIGGLAELFVAPRTEDDACEAVALARREGIPVFVLGAGTNLLVSDKGIRGMVLSIKKLNFIQCSGTKISAGAGSSLAMVRKVALEHSLSFEFSTGIPGSVGGGLVTNAGTYEGQMSDVVESVVVLDEQFECRKLRAAELSMSYRTSIFERKPYVILHADLLLHNGDKKQMTQRIRDMEERRRRTQPVNEPSAGCVFKNPKEAAASYLIEKAGLKGHCCGKATVSTIHSNFIVNRGGATASDVMALISEVRRRVYALFGVHLDLEIRLAGVFDERDKLKSSVAVARR